MSQDLPTIPREPTVATLIGQIAAGLKRQAETGINDNNANDEETVAYALRCSIDVGAGAGKGMRFMYTRDAIDGQCSLHLCLSFRRVPYAEPADFDHRLARRVAPYFFAPDEKSIVVYPPENAEGKRWNVWHYRLFTTQDWKPTGYRPFAGPADPVCFTWAEYTRALFN